MYILCKKFGTMCRYCSDEKKTEIKRDLVVTPDKKNTIRREETRFDPSQKAAMTAILSTAEVRYVLR